MIRRNTALALLCAQSAAFAQSSGELLALPCKPTTEIASGLRIGRSGGGWGIFVQHDGQERRVLVSAVEPIRPLMAPDAGLLLYFAVDRQHPKNSGWRLRRLADGVNIQVMENQVAPYAACVTGDGEHLAYITSESQAVHVVLRPAMERLRVWAGDVPDDRVFVPR